MTVLKTRVTCWYFYYPDDQTTIERTNALSIGFDIETGGHVFQLHFSNAQAMFDRAFITETTGKWGDGGIYLGFNISRTFGSKNQKSFVKDWQLMTKKPG